MPLRAVNSATVAPAYVTHSLPSTQIISPSASAVEAKGRAEAQIIRDKELITHADKLIKLQNIIVAGVNNYNKRKESAEKIIFSLQNKLKYNEILSQDEENMKFEAELYLSELDLDSNVRTNLITSKSNRDIEDILNMAKELIEMHKK